MVISIKPPDMARALVSSHSSEAAHFFESLVDAFSVHEDRSRMINAICKSISYSENAMHVEMLIGQFAHELALENSRRHQEFMKVMRSKNA